jgi:ATP-binding cassette subfamily F protein uup
MAVLLSAQNLSKSFGARPLFEGLSFGLNDGERTGLIGPNGTGKSTLLKILAGQEESDGGDLAMRKGLRLAYLSQKEAFTDPLATVSAVLMASLDGLHLQDYEKDLRVDTALSQAGFPDPAQAVGTLSGGWRKRLAILTQVVKEPDLLLLDEPTNHMDLEGVLWLEDYLSGLDFSFLVVTHDRRFLEKVTNRIIELNKQYKEGYFSCQGNYSRFLEKRDELFNAQAQKEASVANVVRREIEWLRRGPKARSTKQQARISRAGDLMGELDELKYRNDQGRSVDINFASSDRDTRRLVELIKVSKGFGGRKLFGPLDLLMKPGAKLGLLGENGSGKSTLLKVLAGVLEPDSGTVKQADKLQVVTFDQHRDQLDLKLTLRRALCDSGDYVHYKGSPIHVASWAKRFLFTNEQLDMPMSKLSGGEQSRVLIARLMLRAADLLILDEPTNDLDIASLEVLEQSLEEFPGALVLVTHDRYLLDRVSRQLLALDGKGNADFYADYQQWEDRSAEKDDAAQEAARTERAKQLKQIEATERKDAGAAAPAGLSTRETKELKGMEQSIADAEKAVAKAQGALQDPAIAADAAELMKRQAKVDEAQKVVDGLFKRWEELEQRRKSGN